MVKRVILIVDEGEFFRDSQKHDFLYLSGILKLQTETQPFLDILSELNI